MALGTRMARVSLGDVTEIKSVPRGLGTSLQGVSGGETLGTRML